jgi:hypothetical protein
MAGNSNHYDAMVAIESLIDGLSLTGLTGGTVIQEVAWHQKETSGTTLPFVSISPYGPESSGDANSSEDEVGYGILIAIIASPDINTLEARLAWRQKIRRVIRNASLSGQTRNFNLIPAPGPVVEPRAYFERNLYVSGIVVRALYEEPRST